jgi:hypothetical protein
VQYIFTFSLIYIIDHGKAKISTVEVFLFINFVAQLLSSKFGPFHPEAHTVFAISFALGVWLLTQ